MTHRHPILLVEDNEDDVLLALRALRKAGVEAPVEVARDGDQAVAYLADPAHPTPAMVLLDLKLPRRSGLEVLQWIRANPALAGLPVVMFTTSTESADMRQAYALGANSYLKKPVSLADTTALLQSAGQYWLVHNRRPNAEGA